VHAMDDARVHLAPARLGHLRQGRLQTLCGRLAVTELSPFAAAGPNRCRTCYARVDDEGMVDPAELKPASSAKQRAYKPAAEKPARKPAAKRSAHKK
jgi:hypothetical protein